MKHFFAALFTGLLLSFTASAQLPNWPAIVKDGETGFGLANRHKMDAAGNHFISGAFFDSLRLGNTLLTGSSDINGFVAKYSPNWNLQWVLHFDDTTTSIINGLEIDPAGNCYVSGIFASKTSFAGTQLIATHDTISFEPVDGVVAKLSPSGNLIWLRQLSGEGKGGPTDLTLDGNGKLYVSGFFENELTAGSITLNGPGGFFSDGFLLKMDISGNFIWGEKTTSTEAAGYTNITTDPGGNVIVTGNFYDGVMVGGFTFIDTSPVQPASNLLIVKYSPSGAVLWAHSAVGNIQDDEITANTVKTDAAGNSYLIGAYGPQSLNFGTVTLPAVAQQGYSNGFLAKYSSTGVLQWAKAVTSTGYAGVSALAVDAAGNSYVGGSFEDNITFGTQTLSPAATGDLFFAKYSPAGVFQWVQQGNSTEEAGIFDILLTASNDIFLTGGFLGSMQLPGGPQISTTNDIAIFYASTIPLLASPSLLMVNKDLGLFPNPTRDKLTITLPEGASVSQIRIFAFTGQRVLAQELKGNSKSIGLNLPDLPSGVYLVEVQTGNEVLRQRLVIR